MKRIAHAMVLSAVLAASGVLAAWGVLADMAGRPYVLAYLEQFAHSLAMGLVVIATIAACEAGGARGAARMLVQALALALAVTGAAYAIATVARPHSLIATMGIGVEGLVPAFMWYGFAAAIFLSWYYALRERAAFAIDALAGESVLRHAALRRADEARLNALRAQIDPVSLDAKLVAIDAAYHSGAEAGDRLLDELIDHLTEALAGSRGASSSS